jgi:Fur family peroxide stress response transcriptional regulator
MAAKRSGNPPAYRAAESEELFKNICREAGLKITNQRLEIFRILARDTGHPSAEEVYEKVRVRIPTISLDTVYRTLATLEEHGVLSRILVDARIRYDPNAAVHHHFVCTKCNRIDDFYWPSFDRTPLPSSIRRHGKVGSRRVELRGICLACLDKSGRKKS